MPSHTKLRVEKAVELFKKMEEDGKHPTILTLSGGTPHKPNPLNQAGFPIWESTAAASSLIKMGIPPRCIFEESFSLDTVGNVKEHYLFTPFGESNTMFYPFIYLNYSSISPFALPPLTLFILSMICVLGFLPENSTFVPWPLAQTVRHHK